ncbi:UNVERIFIED_CONTAM: hypothetical protein Slati_4432200 [Sesamum latifolium]|uniref:Uncharacterized protein n=1 Tax=Sesamum latifolium TaxID=2727402 RepID=A0AAW2SQ99_9LAMI
MLHIFILITSVAGSLFFQISILFFSNKLSANFVLFPVMEFNRNDPFTLFEKILNGYLTLSISVRQTHKPQALLVEISSSLIADTRGDFWGRLRAGLIAVVLPLLQRYAAADLYCRCYFIAAARGSFLLLLCRFGSTFGAVSGAVWGLVLGLFGDYFWGRLKVTLSRYATTGGWGLFWGCFWSGLGTIFGTVEDFLPAVFGAVFVA